MLKLPGILQRVFKGEMQWNSIRFDSSRFDSLGKSRRDIFSSNRSRTPTQQQPSNYNPDEKEIPKRRRQNGNGNKNKTHSRCVISVLGFWPHSANVLNTYLHVAHVTDMDGVEIVLTCGSHRI